MKNLIFMAFMLLISMNQAKAQSANDANQTLLKGKYKFCIAEEKSKNGYSIQLLSNLPGIYQIDLQVDGKDDAGNIQKRSIHQRKVGSDMILLQSEKKFQQVTIHGFRIRYSEFGEDYCLQWDDSGLALKFTKQGREYTYANPFELVNNIFNYTSENYKRLTEPMKSEDISFSSK